jgi:hypothetical protein
MPMAEVVETRTLLDWPAPSRETANRAATEFV